MTDVASNTPLQITINPLPQGQAGRLINANPMPGNIPDSPQFWGQNGFSFKSFLDMVNPLQHIPVVSTIYQSVTGDIPSSGASLAGGALFGGPIGFASSLINEIVKTQTGTAIDGNMLSLLQGNSTTQLAENTGSGGGMPLSANQRANYNAYVKTQQNISASG